MPNDELVLWQASVCLHSELSCASCLKQLARPVAPATCGHLLCRGCAEDLLATAAEPRDVVHRPSLGIRLSGHGAFPAACLAAELETARDAKEGARAHLVEVVHDALQGRVDRAVITIELSTVYTEQCYATLHLPTAELERLAVEQLDGKPLFAGAAKMSVAKHRVPHLTCPCPASGCGRRFAASDLLDVEKDVSEHVAGTRWSPVVREFVVAAALRRRREAAAAARAERGERAAAEAQAAGGGAGGGAGAGAGAGGEDAAAASAAPFAEVDIRVDDDEEDIRVCDLPRLREGKLGAVARAVAAGAALGERTVVFVDHPLLVSACVEAIGSVTMPTMAPPTALGARALRAVGVKATSKRSTLEAAKAALGKPFDAGGADALVITLRAGAVGHNLTCASRVVFLAPCLDTSTRKQAVGRCHRMGQTRPVVVTTLALAGTVEEAALGVMYRDDLPPRLAPSGAELRDQEALRLAAIEEAVLGPRSS